MNYTTPDDIQLLQLLREDDEGGFAEIYNRYWKTLFTTAFNILQDVDLAKDVVQDVFISLWQRRKRAEILSLKPYLQQAARFQVLKLIRAQKTQEQFYERLAAVTADLVYESPLLFKEQEDLVENILKSLPPDCQLVFKKSREEKLTYKEIAAQLNISEKTVEKRMTICLKHFRAVLLKDNELCLILLLGIALHG